MANRPSRQVNLAKSSGWLVTLSFTAHLLRLQKSLKKTSSSANGRMLVSHCSRVAFSLRSSLAFA
jgi:hypothetical protein